MSDAEVIEEELSALEAIFGDDCDVNREERLVEIHVPSRDHVPNVVLRAHLPPTYPSCCAPVVDLVVGPHCPTDLVNAALEGMLARFVPGEVTLFNWVEYLKEEHSHLYELPQQSVENGSDPQLGGDGSGDEQEGTRQDEDGEQGGGERTLQKSQADADIELMEAMRPLIVSGEPYTEKKSTFQAHLAPVKRTEEVFAVVGVLLECNKIRNATHNIMAYRIQMPEKKTVNQDADDDGESSAGGRLLHMMQAADALDVVVVVSRWFGGVLLGPARFALINNTARVLLEAQGYISKGSGSASKGKQGKGPQSKLGPKK